MIYAENILLCIAIPLVVSLLFLRGDVRRFVGAFLLGMAVCLISAYISGFINLTAGMTANDAAVFLAPVVEELMKLFPLLFFLVLFAPADRTMTMLAVAIGAGFATFENCCYILTNGAGSLPYILIRGLAVGVMHIVSVAALSIWLIAAKRLGVFSFPAVVGGLSLAMIFHAMYNLLVSVGGLPSIIGYLLPLLTAAALVFLYRRLPILSLPED
ncbi:MAG: PrsW family intramembrane metalloprotease [Clostridia bacterium]|nr:PrsW family intramembrane metalloprotease [Clostridia bacterium]